MLDVLDRTEEFATRLKLTLVGHTPSVLKTLFATEKPKTPDEEAESMEVEFLPTTPEDAMKALASLMGGSGEVSGRSGLEEWL